MIPQPKVPRKRGPWWLFGAVGGFVLAQFKAILPLLGLGTFGGAVLSMFVSIGAYAIVAPLQLAIGIVALVLVHEIGHVLAARRKGLPTSAPVFIPFIGALVNMRRHPRDAATEAYIALGGPIIGTLGALVVLGGGLLWTSPLLVATAYVGLILNLLNLLPIFPLDGGKIVVVVSRWLWLIGLMAGLAGILYYQMYALLALWLVFAWELYRKTVRRKGKSSAYTTWSTFKVAAEPLDEQGIQPPGNGFSLDVPFTTYSELVGKQKVELSWQEVGLIGTTSLPVQAIIRRCRVVRVDVRKKDGVKLWLVRCQIDYELYENDAYYHVSSGSRWRIGLTYVALTAFLLYMLTIVAGIGMPEDMIYRGIGR